MEVVCDDGAENKRVVEDTTVYLVYQIVFWTLYGVLALYCFNSTLQYWIAQRKISWDRHTDQVIVSLGLGAVMRAASFALTNCWTEEALRALKDVFFVLSFSLVVLFWVEIQVKVRHTTTVHKLRPYLYAIMVLYTVFRLGQFVGAVFISSMIKNLFTGLCSIVYLVLMLVAIVYGYRLLKRMRQINMRRGNLHARLKKMTMLLLGENVVLVILLIAFLIRRIVFASAKEDDPWLWWYLKLIEKVMEYIAILILCWVMVIRTNPGQRKELTKFSSGSGTASSRKMDVVELSEHRRRAMAQRGSSYRGKKALDADSTEAKEAKEAKGAKEDEESKESKETNDGEPKHPKSAEVAVIVGSPTSTISSEPMRKYSLSNGSGGSSSSGASGTTRASRAASDSATRASAPVLIARDVSPGASTVTSNPAYAASRDVSPMPGSWSSQPLLKASPRATETLDPKADPKAATEWVAAEDLKTANSYFFKVSDPARTVTWHPPPPGDVVLSVKDYLYLGSSAGSVVTVNPITDSPRGRSRFIPPPPLDAPPARTRVPSRSDSPITRAHSISSRKSPTSRADSPLTRARSTSGRRSPPPASRVQSRTGKTLLS